MKRYFEQKNLKKETSSSLLYTLTYFVSLVPLKLYDLTHGTEFSGLGKKEEDNGWFEYYPSPMFSFPSLKRYIQKNLQNGRGHAVLDIGCGKGFVLQFFSRLDFDAVSGIEYDEKLSRLAGENLKNNPKTVTVYQTDAMDFSLYQYYDTYYLYNPFDETILEKCIGRILSTLESHPRKLTVFYCNPVCGDFLKKKGFREAGHFYYKTTVFVFHGEK